MIKLVLSDMDGTLLHNDKTKPVEIDGIYEELISKGIYCGAASGRSIQSLLENFPMLKKTGTFIADNGAIIWHKGEIIYKSVLPSIWVKEVLKALSSKEDIHPVFCGLNQAYALKHSKKHDREFRQYYPTVVYVDDLFLIEEDCIKLAIYDDIEAKTNTYPLVKQYEDRLQIVVSAKEWLDVNVPNIDKGSAIIKLQELLSLTKDECLAFGDYNNDIGMLKNVTYSYAMENAVQEVKDVSNFTCSSNEDEGVIEVLKKEFDL